MRVETNHIKQLLSGFESVDLQKLDSIKLLDRQDSKSVFHVDLLPRLLESLQPHYYSLKVNNKQLFKYETLYFDTPTLSLYHAHHRGRLNRYKIRYRKYVDAGVVYFEIKKKNNKGRNMKYRIRVNDIEETLCPACIDLINEKTIINSEELSPGLKVHIDRITLISKDLTEKATIDLNVLFEQEGNSKDMDGLVIAELKQGNFTPRSKFLQVQHQLRIYPSNVSKYCLGIMQMDSSVKRNRFKPRMLKIEKMTAEGTVK